MEILERLRCFYENADCDECMLDVRDAIEELERLYAERRWIPVEERLPEEGVSVLVNHWITGIEMAYRRGDQWGITWTGFIGSDSGYSHWMPLPSPPDEAT